MVMGLPSIPSRCSAHHDAFGDSECRLHVTHMWQARWGQNTHETTKAFRIIHYPKDLQTLLRRDTVAPPVAIPPWRFHVLEAVSHPADMRTPWWHCHSQQLQSNKMLVHWHTEPTKAAGVEARIPQPLPAKGLHKKISEVPSASVCYHFVREIRWRLLRLQNAFPDSLGLRCTLHDSATKRLQNAVSNLWADVISHNLPFSIPRFGGLQKAYCICQTGGLQNA